MEEYNNSPIQKRGKPGDRIATGHDNEEQRRALKMLQRSLAERIRKQQLETQGGQTDRNA
ncbi:hypothetical protein [Parasphingorhabdus sp.]|uniref:hypothetical protein n=1 Tax=Parasphingorhabdus sp. TaxID=2709688 RepID=UPI003A9283A6